jgi:hypothetical protein
MTAASRGQKTAFPTATSTVAELPQWGCPADPQPHLNHPRQRTTSAPPDVRLSAEREGCQDKRD